MKKFLSIVLALALVFSLGITAAADETGSITITNPTYDQTYTVYKLFDATIVTTASGTGVSYSIDPDNNQFFDDLFGVDGTQENLFFVYNSHTGEVKKKDQVNDSELIKYLNDLINGGTYTEVDSYKVEDTTEDTVVFDDLAYGYYLITSSLGTTVTINSNTPDVEVIDKNQEPGTDFDKQVQTGVDAHGDPTWSDESNDFNNVAIGDKFSYRISFTATNYDGDKKIKYYQIHDEKGDSIWVEFDSFEIKVNGIKLDRGYYLSQGGVNTGNWEFLGDWSAIPEADRDRNDAQWYLVHLGYDQFRITIPWLKNHDLQDVTGGKYELKFDEDAEFAYKSPVEVEVVYDAVLESNAVIGDSTHGNRFNKANATWTSEHETGTTPPDEVVTYTYGIGLLKDDIATGVNLAGAVFRIYRDEACTEEVFVIPTDVDGVYIVDSLYMPIESVTGTGKEPSRTVFAAYLNEYLNGKTQDNYVVSQVNGKLAILGLEAGTYYLREVAAPDGYNALSQPIAITAGQDIRPFVIYANDAGDVADVQTETGDFKAYTLSLTQTVVHNSKGAQLPSTGGQGTFWLITIGTLMAIGFAVFMITHKKMSVYTD